MKTFIYKGYDRGGHACKGLVEALSTKEARERLAARGVLAERLYPSGKRAPFRPDAQRSASSANISALLTYSVIRGLFR